MSGYRTVQRSPILLPVIAVLVALSVLTVVLGGTGGWQLALVVFLLLLAVLIVDLSTLTVEVGAAEVSATFRYGWPVKRIPLDDVVATRRVRNAWWVGIGIRKVRRGWMYNVWGLESVQLDRADGRVFRIGTADPDGLLAAIEAAQTH